MHCTLCLFLAVCRPPSSVLTHTRVPLQSHRQTVRWRFSAVCFGFFSSLLFVIGGPDDRGEREEEEVRQLSPRQWCGVVSWVEVGNPSSELHILLFWFLMFAPFFCVWVPCYIYTVSARVWLCVMCECVVPVMVGDNMTQRLWPGLEPWTEVVVSLLTVCSV